MVSSFNHTGIVVKDVGKMVAFYTEVLGLKKLREIDSVAPPTGDHTGIPGARRKLVFVGFPDGHQIELVHYIDPPSPRGHLDKHQFGATHICFNVDDLASLHRALSSRGVKFVTTPKFRDMPGGKIGIVYAQDPEGNWLEFIES
ncbi:MAG: VOC family protein [SAR202 cluster bacterium]|nr:VOC family protein [SAR202 cluster bacterium]